MWSLSTSHTPPSPPNRSLRCAVGLLKVLSKSKWSQFVQQVSALIMSNMFFTFKESTRRVVLLQGTNTLYIYVYLCMHVCVRTYSHHLAMCKTWYMFLEKVVDKTDVSLMFAHGACSWASIPNRNAEKGWERSKYRSRYRQKTLCDANEDCWFLIKAYQSQAAAEAFCIHWLAGIWTSAPLRLPPECIRLIGGVPFMYHIVTYCDYLQGIPTINKPWFINAELTLNVNWH